MIEERDNELIFTFPEIHPEARLCISFQKTLRIPDDGNDYPLPPGLGRFPLKHVDDYQDNLPEAWIKRGGVMLPIYQSEAMWINFESTWIREHRTGYPFVIKIAAGKICAVTGRPWSDVISREPQNYMVIPDQPWLDGYCIEQGVVRQFVAMPLGKGYTAEGQITGAEDIGGLQIQVYPMKRKAFEKYWPEQEDMQERFAAFDEAAHTSYCLSAPDMGLAPGGRMHQEIYEDEYELFDWDLSTSSRCFVHLSNSEMWTAITGSKPPTIPPTARQYSEYGLPWFDHYSDSAALSGSAVLAGLKSVTGMGREKRDNPLPENETAIPEKIIRIQGKKSPNQVREW